MAEDEIEKMGVKPLADELGRIKNIRSQKDLVDEVARLHERQVDSLFNFGASPDPDDAKMEMAGLDQAAWAFPKKITISGPMPTQLSCGRSTSRISPKCSN